MNHSSNKSAASPYEEFMKEIQTLSIETAEWNRLPYLSLSRYSQINGYHTFLSDMRIDAQAKVDLLPNEVVSRMHSRALILYDNLTKLIKRWLALHNKWRSHELSYMDLYLEFEPLIQIPDITGNLSDEFMSDLYDALRIKREALWDYIKYLKDGLDGSIMVSNGPNDQAASIVHNPPKKFGRKPGKKLPIEDYLKIKGADLVVKLKIGLNEKFSNLNLRNVPLLVRAMEQCDLLPGNVFPKKDIKYAMDQLLFGKERGTPNNYNKYYNLADQYQDVITEFVRDIKTILGN